MGLNKTLFAIYIYLFEDIIKILKNDDDIISNEAKEIFKNSSDKEILENNIEQMMNNHENNKKITLSNKEINVSIS